MDYKPKIKLSQDEFRVLASNTRIEILKLLDESQFTVSDISRKLDMNKATVHEHLSKLMEVGLVKKDDSPRKWVYYRLTWKGRNLLHPERVRVMVSLGIMLTVIVVGALLIALSTDFVTTSPPDGPEMPQTRTMDVVWGEGASADTYDVHVHTSAAVTVAQVKDLKMYIEPDAMSMTYRTPIELSWAWESDVIHIYDYDDDLEEHEGSFLYVEGTLLDDKAVEWPFTLRRYLLPTGWEIDLRISPVGISIDTSNLSQGLVGITFEVENRGNMEVNDTLVEVFSIHPSYKALGFPTYGSPYLWEVFNTTVSLPVNSSRTVTFSVPVEELWRKGVMVVIDPDNAMPEMPVENNMATEELPDDIAEYNRAAETDASEGADLNLGFVAIMVAAIIIVVLVVVALLVLRND
jgi:DNA-binding transcriptional ArsR family regulator